MELTQKMPPPRKGAAAAVLPLPEHLLTRLMIPGSGPDLLECITHGRWLDTRGIVEPAVYNICTVQCIALRRNIELFLGLYVYNRR